jgi:hypothetical protein
MTGLSDQDVLIFIKSEVVMRWVLPSDALDEASRNFRAQGFFTALPALNYGGLFAGLSDAGYSRNEPVKDKELPEAEDEIVRRACVAIYSKGKKLDFVDVGKETAFRRVIEEHLQRLRSFPVLVRSDDRRLKVTENFARENLERFLSD